jgi:hypothetical protein
MVEMVDPPSYTCPNSINVSVQQYQQQVMANTPISNMWQFTG